MAGCGKTSHLSAGPPTLVTDARTLEDSNLLHQVLSMMEPKIQELVFHCVGVKELWCFLCELYNRSSNINMAYDIIQELFQKK